MCTHVYTTSADMARVRNRQQQQWKDAVNSMLNKVAVAVRPEA